MNPMDWKKGAETSSISQEQFEKIAGCLTALSEKLRVKAVLLADRAGRMIVQKSDETFESDPSVISSLVAGSFGASNELARLLGEKGRFNMVLHEGRGQSVFICSVTAEYFLVVVFETHVALGMVRMLTRRTVAELEPVLAQKDEGHDMKEMFDDRFESLLGEELDRTMKDRC
ncbi:roadblock/LC7 domain-containing protein [bacterium]|nr:roadblock/LC7 domain-containing protein [bacterium]